MSLDIPDEARERGARRLAEIEHSNCFGDGPFTELDLDTRVEYIQTATWMLEAAAPLVVAAELNRLADQIEREAHTPDPMAAQSLAMAALDDAVRRGALAMGDLLSARARELRESTHDQAVYCYCDTCAVCAAGNPSRCAHKNEECPGD